MLAGKGLDWRLGEPVATAATHIGFGDDGANGKSCLVECFKGNQTVRFGAEKDDWWHVSPTAEHYL